ncbi:MAG: GDP-mannose 4,6-dehydratase [Acidimicrobiales bacterium]
MKVLVTGASGFAGRHLIEHLRASGDEVVASDRRDGGPDLLDGDAWSRLLDHHQPQQVYHLAAQASVQRSWQDGVATLRANVEGTFNVLAACREHGVARVLMVSSADVYGRVDPALLPLREDTPLRPLSPYAASKAAAEQVALQAFHGGGLEVIRVRPFNHLGPGQDDRFVAGALAARIVRAERGDGTVTVGNLDAVRDFTDVRDVVRAYRAVLQHGEPGAVYHVSSGRPVAVSTLAALLCAAAETPIRLVTDPALLRPAEVPTLVGDATALHTLTGWEPTIDLADTLADLLADHRRQCR